MVVEIEVKSRIAKTIKNAMIVSHNSGDTVKFIFDEEWEPESITATRTALFVFGSEAKKVVFNGNSCELPFFDYNGNVYVGVFWGDKRCTTPATLLWNLSIRSLGGKIVPPTKEVYDQIINLMNEKVNEAQLELAVKSALEEAKNAGEFGANGKSAYQIWLAAGNEGTEADFLASLEGTPGANGKSAYQIWLAAGNEGTEAEFLASLEGAPGDNGKSAYQIWLAAGNEGTEAEFLASLKGADGTTQLVPLFANSIEECTDTSKLYVLPDGYIYAYASDGGTTIETVTEQIVGTTDNPWGEGRLGSGGTVSTQDGYAVTPYIDLSKYDVPFEVHLEGITFIGVTYTTCSQYKTDKAHIQRHDTNATAFATYWKNATLTDNGDGTCKISFTPPVTNKSDVEIGYVRFTGNGTEADANVYITYETEVSACGWKNTGHAFVPADYEDRFIALEKVVANFAPDEDVSIAEFTLVNPATKSFMDSEAYDDSDYSYTNVLSFISNEAYRKDLPLPILLGWNNHSNAVEYVVSVGKQVYYTEHNRIAIYNLIPNTTYSYKVQALCSYGTKALVEDGIFTTASDSTRMLNIDGIQNVRDIGGYTALNGNVKYGLIFRGGAMDEAIAGTFRITDLGKQEMCQRVGIKTDLDLRYGYNESALGVGVEFVNTASGYESYASAITNEIQRENFKALLEAIVAQLINNKPIYIHCSGGCDRTGTFVFLLLGLLGVSESDLAKEYELSSFSAIGSGRYRNSTVYNYSGMVEAIKAYSGDTITDKFVSFATDCGITSDTITSFRNLMLE